MNHQQIAQALQSAREKLLDLSLRNRLLNHRPYRRRGVEVSHADPKSLIELLVAKNVPLRLQSVIDNPDEVHQPGEADATILKTTYSDDELFARLLTTYRAARLSIQEQGINILFLTIGMLHWYESPSSERSLKAPLLLIPVELQRRNVTAHFVLTYTGEEVLINPAMVEKLRRFGVDDVQLPNLAQPENLDIDACFQTIEQKVGRLPRWHISNNTMLVDTFSYSKHPMYLDLDTDGWPEGQKPGDHPIMQAILGGGFVDREPSLADDSFLDEHVTPEELSLVVDADSSQIHVIEEARKGKSLVVEGPPGTGKSQTITNLIAQAVSEDKTVLFVSEKMAALEVVEQNLKEVGLGKLCLELHSHKTNKRNFVEELERTRNFQLPPGERVRNELQAYQRARNALNDYASAVNTPVANSEKTPYQIYGSLQEIQGRFADHKRWPNLRITGMARWDADDWESKRSLVANLESWCADHGPPGDHELWGSDLRAVLPTTLQEIIDAGELFNQSLKNLQIHSERIAEKLRAPPPNKHQHITDLQRAAQVLLNRPPSEGVRPLSPEWAKDQEQILCLIKARKELQEIRRRYGEKLQRTSWKQDLEESRQDLIQLGTLWWRAVSPRYRRARNHINKLFRGLPPRDNDLLLTVIDDIIRAQELRTYLSRYKALGEQLFTHGWSGQHNDWEQLIQTANWVIKVYRNIAEGRLPRYTLVGFEGNNTVDRQAYEALKNAQTHYNQATTRLLEVHKINEAKLLGDDTGFRELPFCKQQEFLHRWHVSTDQLQAIVRLNHLLDELQQNGLESVVAAANRPVETGRYLLHAFETARYHALIEVAFEEYPILAQFSGTHHDTVIETFRKLDKNTQETKRTKLQEKHNINIPHQLRPELERELRRRRGHKPIRQILATAADDIQRLKPIFMMSPLSIAKYLSPGSVNFDVVIFDEASQVRPEEALGAILRAEQVIVIGDSKQLPPTSFFDNDALEEEGEETTISVLESILDVFSAQRARKKMLRWHYRSEHESLIAVSNEFFYTPPGLNIFPSPVRDGLGLRFHHLPATTYESGRNLDEARSVARAVMAHAQNEPHMSLGVAAFNQQQMTAIEDQLEILRRENPEQESFFSSDNTEPFFVKNLETIQGDERDIIFISIGFGRDRNERISMNFGPVNQAGGERRLNVLMTRARKRCEIFSNLSYRDIRLTGSKGLEVLKVFLEYAETGRLALPERSQGGFESPFEKAVHTQLTAHGYDVIPQVGVAGYFIDLAVVDPDQGGRYLLGIECDGASYHSARSARDRDRLRQQVLERRGWRIHRIWSTDWFHNPARELEKIVEAIERAQAAKASPSREGASLQVSPEIAVPEPISRHHRAQDELQENSGVSETDAQETTVGIKRLSDLVTNILSLSSDPLLATEIRNRLGTSHGINVDKSTVNRLLYSQPQLFARDESFRWTLLERGIAEENREQGLATKNGASAMRQSDDSSNEDQRFIEAIPSNCWVDVAHWSRTRGIFNARARGLLFRMGNGERDGILQDPEKVRTLADLYHRATEQGFSCR